MVECPEIGLVLVKNDQGRKFRLKVLNKIEHTFWSIDLNLLSILTFDFLFRWTGLNFELVLNFSNLSSPPVLTIFSMFVSKFIPKKGFLKISKFFTLDFWTKMTKKNQNRRKMESVFLEKWMTRPIFSEKFLKRAFLLIGQFLIGQNFRLESSVSFQLFSKVFSFSETSNWSLWDRNKIINSCFFVRTI